MLLVSWGGGRAGNHTRMSPPYRAPSSQPHGSLLQPTSSEDWGASCQQREWGRGSFSACCPLGHPLWLGSQHHIHKHPWGLGPCWPGDWQGAWHWGLGFSRWTHGRLTLRHRDKSGEGFSSLSCGHLNLWLCSHRKLVYQVEDQGWEADSRQELQGRRDIQGQEGTFGGRKHIWGWLQRAWGCGLRGCVQPELRC